jgi:hypothetical protein
MGISLFGLTPAATYPALIKFGDNSAISGTLRALSDGLGTDLPIQVSTAGVNFTGTASIGGTAIVTNASGVSGAIQFSNGSAFASDATNFFWDDTNNRLGVGTNAPTNTFEIASTSTSPFKVATTAGYFRATYRAGSTEGIFDYVDGTGFSFPTNNVVFGTSSSLGARLGIRGSGSTSATTSLLVQNSAGTQLFKIADDGAVNMAGVFTTGTLQSQGNIFFNNILYGNNWWAQNDGGTTIGQQGAPVASAILDIRSTTRGFLPPRMTTTQKNAIASPATGLVLYDSTTNKLQCYNGSTWNDLF